MALVYFFFRLIPYVDRNRVRQLKEIGLYDPFRNGAVLLFGYSHLLLLGIGIGWIDRGANLFAGLLSLAAILIGYHLKSLRPARFDRLLKRVGVSSVPPAPGLRLQRPDSGRRVRAGRHGHGHAATGVVCCTAGRRLRFRTPAFPLRSGAGAVTVLNERLTLQAGSLAPAYRHPVGRQLHRHKNRSGRPASTGVGGRPVSSGRAGFNSMGVLLPASRSGPGPVKSEVCFNSFCSLSRKSICSTPARISRRPAGRLSLYRRTRFLLPSSPTCSCLETG